jgi:thioredoxin-dependent peroxiredoxin
MHKETAMTVGKKVANFKVPATDGTFTLSAHLGHPLVLYFYPKDNTPGCTTEGAAFRDLYPQFVKLGAEVFGVSRDSIKSHEGFKEKMSFPFPLLSDADEKLCTQFDVIKMKNMYGKKVRGIERSTFLIGADGKLVREWRRVKVDGHAEEVLAAVKAL